jgi:hypothetical protein
LALFSPTASAKEIETAPTVPVKSQESPDTDPASRRGHILEELQSTERHFLARMQHLLQDYHIPLKTRAKSTDPLLNMYETFYAALEAAEEQDIPKILLEHVYPIPI